MKVQGKGTNPAYTIHPKLNCTHPTVATVSTKTPMVRSTAESTPVIVYKLATRQFAKVPCQRTRPQNEESNPPPLEDIPNAPPRQSPLLAKLRVNI